MSADVCPCCGRPDIKVEEKTMVEAKLTPKERVLFSTIARRRGDETTLSAIFDALWGDDPNGGPDHAENVIRQFVMRSRAKLAPFGFGIETVHGIGYRLVTVKTEAAA